MKSLYIINGFADIKRQFIKKRGLQKASHELKLWFSFEHEILYVHDYEDHDKCMIIGLFEDQKYKCYLDRGDHAIDVFELALAESKTGDVSIAKKLNDLYKLHGALGTSTRL